MGEQEQIESLQRQVSELRREFYGLHSDLAVVKSETAGIQRQIDNWNTEHARQPQTTIAIISLVLTAVMTLFNLFMSGSIP